jgi:hypothetical protein
MNDMADNICQASKDTRFNSSFHKLFFGKGVSGNPQTSMKNITRESVANNAT